MARKRYKTYQSSWSSRPSVPPQKPEFHALLDLIDANREALPRRASSTLNGYLQTLESNLQSAQEVIHSPAFVSQEREASLRLTLAQAALTQKQEQRNAVHQAASLPARWFGWSIPTELQRELAALQHEVKEAERHLSAVQGQEAKLRLRASQPFPLDSKTNAQNFVDRATEIRALLYQALSGEVRQAEETRLVRDRALAAAHLEKTRDLAESVKKRLRRDHPCPYCDGPLGSEAACRSHQPRFVRRVE